MKTVSKEEMGIEIGGKIEKVDGKELSYDEFVERYFLKNQPVILTGLMDDWKACSDWVSSDGHPNLEFLSTHFGKSIVQVADCGTRDFTDQKRVEMSVSEFIDHWLKNYVGNCVNGSSQDPSAESLLYLKDWHFVKEYPEYSPYTTPLFFCDDWLNLYLDNHQMHTDDTYVEKSGVACSDYRFVYMGAKGTWTPLHADVFRSYSWSANVCGQKRWLFLPPSQSHLVFDRNMKSSVYNIFENVNETKFPGFRKAIWLECIQESNEIIFVPSGWYHQVHNQEATISINHNWFNAYSLSWVWDLLMKDYNEARGYIDDIRDICDNFEGLCQRNLAANTGMNFHDFSKFIARFSFANLVLLYYLHTYNGHFGWNSSQIARHLVLNLTSIRKIAVKMRSLESHSATICFLLDFRETLNDPKFLQLCTGLAATYEMIHKLQSLTFNIKIALMDNSGMIAFTKGFGSRICNPDDLVKFIDHAAPYFCDIFNVNYLLPTKLD